MIVYEEANVVYSEASSAMCDCVLDGGDCNQCGGAWSH